MDKYAIRVCTRRNTADLLIEAVCHTSYSYSEASQGISVNRISVPKIRNIMFWHVHEFRDKAKAILEQLFRYVKGWLWLLPRPEKKRELSEWVEKKSRLLQHFCSGYCARYFRRQETRAELNLWDQKKRELKIWSGRYAFKASNSWSGVLYLFAFFEGYEIWEADMYEEPYTYSERQQTFILKFSKKKVFVLLQIGSIEKIIPQKGSCTHAPISNIPKNTPFSMYMHTVR